MARQVLVLVGRSLERDHSEDLRYRWEGNIKMVLKNQGGGHEMNMFGREYRQVAGRCEIGKAISVHIMKTIKGGEGEKYSASHF